MSGNPIFRLRERVLDQDRLRCVRNESLARRIEFSSAGELRVNFITTPHDEDLPDFFMARLEGGDDQFCVDVAEGEPDVAAAIAAGLAVIAGRYLDAAEAIGEMRGEE